LSIANFIKPQILTGLKASLIPLEAKFIDELYHYGKDESLWTHYTFREMKTYERFKDFIMSSVNAMGRGENEFTFCIIDNESNKAVGTTSFLDIQPASKSLEIGRTWIAKYLQGTGFNAECKYLLLTHCFETLGLIRVFFKTDSNNLRSQKAMEKIGAKHEGILRNHMIREDGSFRHSAYYSIIKEEWPEVKLHLEKLLSKNV
jgi:RimJ/RimL family protein N-acetyltransferase